MVQALAQAGLRVVMDVVYNHTNAAGHADKSVLDKIVPGYYHRLNADTGNVETSHLLRQHRHRAPHDGEAHDRHAGPLGPRLQGGRLPLRPDGPPHEGQHAERPRRRSTALTPATDGVDGSTIYLYGEGWDFGEVRGNNAAASNATQANMAGTGIGTFNDRIRDAVRGGSPFDSGDALVKTPASCSVHRLRGPGLRHRPRATDPNELNVRRRPALEILLADADWIKSGMAGGLRDFRAHRTPTARRSRPAGHRLQRRRAPATPWTPRSRSTTSRRTTTRRSGTSPS